MFKTIRKAWSKAKEKVYEVTKTVVTKAHAWAERACEHLENTTSSSSATGIVRTIAKKTAEGLGNFRERLDKAIYGEQIRRGKEKLGTEPVDVTTAENIADCIKREFPGQDRPKIQKELAAMTRDQRIAKMEEIAQKIATTMQVNPTVKIQPLPAGYRGAYREIENTIYINAVLLEDDFSERAIDSIDTIIHELNHARQWAAIKGQDLGYSKGRIRQYTKNWLWYFSGCDERYWKQPIEADSQRMVAQTWEALGRRYEE